jgi:MFS transporter, DHA1 family, inner membrane transport protein
LSSKKESGVGGNFSAMSLASQGASVNTNRLFTILSFGNFAIGMGAFVVIGILTPIADAFGLTKAAAGFVMTAYAIGYAVLSPVGVALTGKLSRRTVMITGLSLFLLAMATGIFAPSANVLFATRVLAALGAGLFTPVAASVAISLAAPEVRGKAIASVFAGLTLAQALGVPFGTWLGYSYGWQSALLVVCALTLLAILLIAATVPKEIPFQVNSLSTLGAALLDWRSLLSVLFTTTFLAAIYILYTYFSPYLAERFGFARDGISTFLLIFGIGAVIGNILGGKLNDRFGSRPTLISLCIIQIIALAAYTVLPLNPTTGGILTLVWSIFGWSFAVAQQTRLVKQTPQRQAVVLSLNAAGIYLGAMLGSSIGGWLLNAYGPAMLGLGAAAMMSFALAHLLLSEKLARL